MNDLELILRAFEKHIDFFCEGQCPLPAKYCDDTKNCLIESLLNDTSDLIKNFPTGAT
jgi:hypothetical protein